MNKKAVSKTRVVRADAQRNLDSLLEAAKEVFAASGVDAPVREIAEKAGVGLGTVYRHFPQRADLIAAVFRHEVDFCADAAPLLAAEHSPDMALEQWLQKFSSFITTKRGLAPALHSGDPAYISLRSYFEERVRPAFLSLIETAVREGRIRSDVDAEDILRAVASLSMSAYECGPQHTHRMVSLLVDGLRYKTHD